MVRPASASSRAERLARRRRRRRAVSLAALVCGLIAASAFALLGAPDGDRAAVRVVPDAPAESPPRSAANGGATPKPPPVSSTAAPRTPPDVLADPAGVGKPWGEVRGLLTFRGNPTRTWYGAGPVPSAPGVRWRFPERAMCSESSEKGETRTWCGTGWTGQPAVFERDGRTWVVFGAYDRAVHFLDAATGERILADFSTGDIIKGSVTVDPDGYPIVYTGSRDNYYRAIAIDRAEPAELWRLSADAVSPTMWNNDWDGAGLVLRDLLLEGGENSQFHVARLRRGYGPDGLVTVDPELVFHAPGWDDELLAGIGNREVSIENSVAVWNDTVYFANSGGLVQGWDLSGLRTGQGAPRRTFRFWTGDDTDASVVVDEEGMLYVASEWERHNARSAEVGQLMKLDPSRVDDPLVWSVDDQGFDKAGFWGTPALHGDLLIAVTYHGRALGVDRSTGALRWERTLPGPIMGSPVVVDGVWIQGDCAGVLHAFDVRDTGATPVDLWSVELGGCIESTPAVWDGGIYVGTRGGYFYALSD